MKMLNYMKKTYTQNTLKGGRFTCYPMKSRHSTTFRCGETIEGWLGVKLKLYKIVFWNETGRSLDSSVSLSVSPACPSKTLIAAANEMLTSLLGYSGVNHCGAGTINLTYFPPVSLPAWKAKVGSMDKCSLACTQNTSAQVLMGPKGKIFSGTATFLW